MSKDLGRLAGAGQAYGGSHVEEREEGVDDDRRLMTSHRVSAMSGSAIAGTHTVM